MRRMFVPAAVAAVMTLVASTLAASAAVAAGDDRSGTTPTSTELPLDTQTGVPSRVVEQHRLADGQTQSVVRFGPIVAMPHREGDGHGGGHEHEAGVAPMHGPHEPMHGTHTTVVGPLVPPCLNCYLTSVRPDLVYRDGQPANYDTGVMLHHAVVFDRSKEDPTCGNGQSMLGLAGQRIFAAGNERTGDALPAGYGIHIGQVPLPWLLVELMNTSSSAQPVYLEFTFTHTPDSSPGMKPVTVVWLDKANCRNSEHNAPKGESHFTWQWTSDRAGTVKTVGGHLHDGGEVISVSNATTGQPFCAMRAGYGNKPAYQGHIDTMSTCSGQNLGTVRTGDTLELNSTYHTHFADPAVMSIALVYLAEQ